MQRASNSLFTAFTKPKSEQSNNTMNKLTMAVLTAGIFSLTGCQTIKNLTGDGEDAIITAEKTDAEYYADAVRSMEKERYIYASEQLSELRTFYPTGEYAEQALLDLMYTQFKSKEYELAAASAEQFIKLYPRNIQVDYAYYVRGVANMQAGHSALINIARLEQAHRDTSYLRLAFSNFQELLSRYPDSRYAPDAAQRMNYIYNQFAESELAAARWYIKREAYVASANRARWVFQYYPLSPQIPEAIAILAYSNEQLGLTDLAKEYKTLLQINYPDWLNNNGQVKLNINRKSGIINMLTFGKLGRSNKDNRNESTAVLPEQYQGETRQQVIQQATQLQLPNDNTTAITQDSLPALPQTRRGINVGLGLPDDPGAQPTGPRPQRRITSPSEMYPDDVEPPRAEPETDLSNIRVVRPTAENIRRPVEQETAE